MKFRIYKQDLIIMLINITEISFYYKKKAHGLNQIPKTKFMLGLNNKKL